MEKIIKNWLKGEVLNDYWLLMDSILSKKKHNRMMWWINDHYYEIVRRYKAREYRNLE